MSGPARWIAAVVVVAAAAALVWWWVREPPVPVAVAPAARGRVERTVANTRAGTVQACRRARIAPATGGQIERLEVREGDRVEAGRLLLELWNDDLAAQLVLAERENVATQARTDEACALAEVAEREAQRLVRLRKQGVAAEETTERAVGEAAARRAGCAAARASTTVSAARIDVARATLDRTILRAPFAGIVAEVNGEIGEFVTPSPVGIPTPPTIDLIDTECVYVSAPIDEVDAAGVRAGLPARITLDAYPGRSFPGVVRRVAPYVLDLEKQARTVDVEVEFTDAAHEQDLLIGYSADIEVLLATRDDVLRIPTEAILEGRRVLVYDDGVLVEREIEPGLANWEFTAVEDGLAEGERVVLSVAREGVAAGARAVVEEEAPRREAIR